MNKYFLIIKNTWDEIVTYRFNFVMWRFRTVLQLITAYYLWATVIPTHGQLFGYNHSFILTYVLVANLLTSIVFSTRTQEIGDNINNGDLSIFLLRPFDYFGYWFAKDLGDKAMNIVFAIGELFIFFLILHPPLLLQKNIFFILFSIMSTLLAVVLYFLISCSLGFIGFWSPEVWAPRFIFSIVVSFFAGGYVPLDVFPKTVYTIFQLLPFSYLLYFPLKIYLGQLSYHEIFIRIATSMLWVIILYVFVQIIWQRGLKMYSAQGR